MLDAWWLYSEEVTEHSKSPENAGKTESPDGARQAGNRLCSDIREFQVKVKDGIIVDANFKTCGCGAAIAASSMVT